MSNYPTDLDTFPFIEPEDGLDTEGKEHDLLHNKAHEAIQNLQQEVGVTGSNDTNSLRFKADMFDAMVKRALPDSAVLKGRVDEYDNLPDEDLSEGDAYFCEEDGLVYVWFYDIEYKSFPITPENDTEKDPHWNKVVLLYRAGEGDLTGKNNFLVDCAMTVGFGGAMGHCVKLDKSIESSKYIDDYDLAGGDFTIEFFVKLPTKAATYSYPAALEIQRNDSYQPYLFFYSGKTLLFKCFYNNSSANIQQALGTCEADVWHHAAVSRQGGNLYCFLDGVLGTTVDVSGQVLNTPTKPITLGCSSSNAYIGATYSDFRITKGVARYTDSFTPPTTKFPSF